MTKHPIEPGIKPPAHRSGFACAGAVITVIVLISSCSVRKDTAGFRASGAHESLTVYTALTPLYGSNIPEDYAERYSELTGFDLNVVPIYDEARSIGRYTKSWYAFTEGSSTGFLDILANLDDLIRDETGYWDYNPVRGKERPDLIVSTFDDDYIRSKALDGYFVPAREILTDAPEFAVAHGGAFWNANFVEDEYGIPLYSFQQDDAPAYWLIDAELRGSLTDRPIETFDELLSFIEYAAGEAPEGKAVVSTGMVSLGAVALHMAYGFLPVEYRYASSVPTHYNRSASAAMPASKAENIAPGVTGGTFEFDILPWRRNAPYLYANLAGIPLVIDPETKEIRNVIVSPPAGFWELIKRICELQSTGRIDMERTDVTGLRGFLTGSIDALFIPDDIGLEYLKTLVNQFPEDQLQGFEILPVSKKPLADLQSCFKAWVPRSTTRRAEIAKWFDELSHLAVFEPLRYGIENGSWTAVSDDGIAPGTNRELPQDCPPGFVLDVLSRMGLPERAPIVVPEHLRSAFRLDDRDETSYIRLDRRELNFHYYDATFYAWKELSTRYRELLSGSADFAATYEYLQIDGVRVLSFIEKEIAGVSQD